MQDTFKPIGQAREEDFERVLAMRGAVRVGHDEPLCFVIDEPATGDFVSAVFGEIGIRTEQFRSFGGMIEIAAHRQPDLLLLDPACAGPDAGGAIRQLGASRLRCPVQLMTGLNAVLVEEARRAGERRGLNMLPVLHKPFRDVALRRVVHKLGLRRDAGAKADFSIAQALQNGWIDVWYQPKIDLGAMLLAGAEGFMRVRHPQHGVLPPESLLIDAAEGELLLLTQHVLHTVLRDWQSFADFGAPIRFSINIPASALIELPLEALLRENRPKASNWPGLILELHEDDVIQDISLVSEAARQLRAYNVGFAVDDFGPGYATLARLKRQPFCELKIDRSFVANCGGDDRSAGLCETVIELAHRFGVRAVAEGVETPLELKALSRMGCDLGQGYLFARPMPKEQFAALVRQRGRPRS